MQRRARARVNQTGETYQRALQAIHAKTQPGSDNDLPPAAKSGPKTAESVEQQTPTTSGTTRDFRSILTMSAARVAGWGQRGGGRPMASDILLTVDDGQPADAARFFMAGTHLLELLDDLSETPDIDWTIEELRRSSGVAGLAAHGAHRTSALASAHSAVAGLTLIREGKGLPDDWTPSALTHAKDLARSTGERTKVETLGKVIWLDQRLRAGLDAIAPWVREFYGSVRGNLTGVNVTRGNRASIRPHGGGRVVHVGFPTPLAAKMRDGLLQFVEITGMIRQNEDGRAYYVAADAISVVEEPALSWRDLRGYMPEITNGLPISEYLDGIRGEQ